MSRKSGRRKSRRSEDEDWRQGGVMGPDRCPFCGSERLVKHDFEWVPCYPKSARKWWRLKCLDCGHLVYTYKKLTIEEAIRGDVFYTEPYWPPCPSCGSWEVAWKRDHYICRRCGQEYTPSGKPIDKQPTLADT